MAKNSIRDFSATAGSNTDIQSVNIDENCPASGINNAIRELMVDLKNVSTGAINLETPGADQLNVDNIRIDGNTISSTDTNGDITLDPAGTGVVAITGVITANGHTSSAPSVFEASGNGDQVGVQLKVKANNGSTSTQGLYGNAGSTNAGNTIVLGNSGSSGLLVDSSGNVGIGEASPAVPLHISTGASTTAELRLTSNNTGSGSGDRGRIAVHSSRNDGTAYEAGRIDIDRSSGTEDKAHILFATNNGSGVAERMRIDSSGKVGVGTTSPDSPLHVIGDGKFKASGETKIRFQNDTTGTGSSDGSFVGVFGGTDGMALYNYEATPMRFFTSNTERMRIDSSGIVLMGKTSSDGGATAGLEFEPPGFLTVAQDGNIPFILNRFNSDGTLAQLRQDGTTEGSITVSGTTVSFNGGHISRWSRLLDGSKPATLLKGTVMSNLDDMIVWTGEDNEQLNHTKVSDTEGDVNAAGVFVSWDNDDEDYNDFFLAMTGDMVIRIASGTTVARGDLLMSAGDGTAKPQDDDIVRSKTIAKVTSTTVSHTYDDGSYLVPCVLMAC